MLGMYTFVCVPLSKTVMNLLCIYWEHVTTIACQIQTWWPDASIDNDFSNNPIWKCSGKRMQTTCG